MSNLVVILSAFAYLLLLFGVAYFAEFLAKKGKSIINNGYVYALSMAVFCTAWTYYGSVGKATDDGVMFLSIYIGPTIMAFFMIPVLGKIIRITKFQRINSIADFISTRYGKNFTIGIVVTIICIIGVIPYISLQLKAITSSFEIIVNKNPGGNIFLENSTLIITLILALFIILFGTRSVDATEKHEGLVAAIAFETIIKLVAFVCAGIFVTYGIFNGFEDIFSRAAKHENLNKLFEIDAEKSSYSSWFTMMFISMMAVIFLPRQFQVSVVENIKEAHLKKATWLFPLYLFLINIFVLPIAFGGILIFGNNSLDADTFVLALPLHFGQDLLGLFIFIGGFSAATSMIILETIAISTMLSNNIIMPVFIRNNLFKKTIDQSFSKVILYVRRISIVLILVFAYLYEKNVAQHFSLVSLGLISFAAVTQFAPSILGGIYWKGATKNGALVGLIAGFTIWFYTLVVPSLANSGVINFSIIENGLFGFSWLKPNALFGLEGFDSITHSVIWSMFFNIFFYIVISVNDKPNAQELYQAEIFVNIYKHAKKDNQGVWKGVAFIPDLNALLENFLGAKRAKNLLQSYAQRNKIPIDAVKEADPRLVDFSEKILAGVIGSASARIMVRSITKEEEISIDGVLKILYESQQLIQLNKELRKKSSELTKATTALTKVNEQLKMIDISKDEFLYTVTHELRTPLTSIRALSEIVHDNPDMEEEQRMEFMSTIVKETERLSHLITQVLNLEKYENGKQRLTLNSFDIIGLAKETSNSLRHLAGNKDIEIQLIYPNSSLLIHADEDLLRQVILNLLSNAIKFSTKSNKIVLRIVDEQDEIGISIEDFGKGIPSAELPYIFDKFFQAHNQTLKKPQGSGLGLAICKKIIEMHNGKIWAESVEGKGSVFRFLIPNFGARKSEQ